MAETIEQYIGRILSYSEGKDPVKLLQQTPQKIAQRTKRVSARKLKKPPAPGKWSVLEILAHLADVELALGYRLRKIAEEDGVVLQGFDQDIWAKNGAYKKADVKQALASYLSVRAMTVHFLKAQPKEVWQRHGQHSQFGQLGFGKIVRMLAGHDINHLRQIERILKS